MTTVHLINRMPLQCLQYASPYAKFFNEQPALCYLKIFGCLCYASNLNPSSISLMLEEFHMFSLVILMVKKPIKLSIWTPYKYILLEMLHFMSSTFHFMSEIIHPFTLPHSFFPLLLHIHHQISLGHQTFSNIAILHHHNFSMILLVTHLQMILPLVRLL